MDERTGEINENQASSGNSLKFHSFPFRHRGVFGRKFGILYIINYTFGGISRCLWWADLNESNYVPEVKEVALPIWWYLDCH